jgi:hypothetical protein
MQARFPRGSVPQGGHHVSTPFVTHTCTTGTHDPFGVGDALTRADQRRSRLQSELNRLPPSHDGWVERHRRRLLAEFAFAADQELTR